MVAQKLQSCEAECPHELPRGRINECANMLRIRRIHEDRRKVRSTIMLFVISVQRSFCWCFIESRQNTKRMLVTKKVFSRACLESIQVWKTSNVHLGERYLVLQENEKINDLQRQMGYRSYLHGAFFSFLLNAPFYRLIWREPPSHSWSDVISNHYIDGHCTAWSK